MTRRRRSAEETKAAILEATRELFAKKGFDRTTIRMIAAKAGCDPALVMRYFGCKRDLFTAAVDSPFEKLPDAPDGSAGDLSAIAGALLESWHTDRTFFGLLRAAASDEEAADLMRQFFDQRVRGHQPRVTGLEPDQAVCFGAMVLGIAFAREVACIPPLSKLSSTELGELVGQVFAVGEGDKQPAKGKVRS